MDSQVDQSLKVLRDTLTALEQLAQTSKRKEDINKAVQSLRDIIADIEEKKGEGRCD